MSVSGGLLTTGIAVQDARPGQAPSKLLDVGAGEQATIGNCRACRLDIRLPFQPWFHLLISAQSGAWTLSNQSSSVDISVEDLEDPLQRVICQRRRQEVVIPFEMARIRAQGRSLLVVSAYEPKFTENPICDEPVRNAWHEVETNIYFLATVLLCSARLQNGPDAPLITQKEISYRLAKLGHAVESRTVRSYLDHFADRLGIPVSDGSKSQVRWWRRELLARAVITQGIVRQEHLKLIQT